jgi:hypothetical protein
LKPGARRVSFFRVAVLLRTIWENKVEVFALNSASFRLTPLTVVIRPWCNFIAGHRELYQTHKHQQLMCF